MVANSNQIEKWPPKRYCQFVPAFTVHVLPSPCSAAERHFTRSPFMEHPEDVLPRVSWLAANFFKEFEQEEAEQGAAEVNRQDVAQGRQQGGRGGGHAPGQRGGAPASAGIPDADLYVLTRILHDW